MPLVRHRPQQLFVLGAVVCLVLVVVVGHEAAVPGIDHTEVSSAQITRVVRGLLLSLLLSLGTLALYWGSLRELTLSAMAGDQPLSDRSQRWRRNVLWFIHVRWVVVAAALGLITSARMPSLKPLLMWWVALVVANLVFELWAKKGVNFEQQILVQAVVDITVLTGFLSASGGLENPLYTAYVFHIIVGRSLLSSGRATVVSLTAAALFCLLACGEYLQVLPHYTNFFFPHDGADALPLADPAVHAEALHASHNLYFVLGRTIPFLTILVLTDFFMIFVMAVLRSSESNLETAARQALVERERLEGVVDASGVGMMQATPEAAITWFSRRVGQWFDWRASSLGSSCPLLAAGCETCVVRNTAVSGRVAEAERRVVLPGGGERYFRHSASPVHDRDGRVVQVVEVIQDVTARRALEAEAARASKMSALGRMAAGIAHEIGNPLASLGTRLSLLERRHQNPSFVLQSVVVLRQQIDRISRIVRGVSHFARVQRADRSRWEINAMLEETIDVVTLDRRARNIVFDRQLEVPSPRVRAVRDQISQIVLNLLLNAVEEMPQGGTVWIASSRRQNEVVFSVTDQGKGIAAESWSQLFEPFFTTKEDGTGLGLSISYGFAAAHGGRIEVDSPAGRGARFSVFLPLAEEIEASAANSTRSTPQLPASGR